MERPLITARLRRSVLLSDRTKHLEFDLPGVEHFDFKPGQFISVREPRPDGKQITRAYSLASAPRADNSFDLCLNRVDTGFMSNYLCDIEPGAEVHLNGPHGHFVLREPRKDVIFIANGTGIAPIRGMLQWLFADDTRNADHRYWLVYGTRYERDIYYREEFDQLAAEHPNFRYLITLSRGDESWPGLRGYVQEHIRELARGHNGDMETYICGLNDMVTGVRELLKSELGWDRKQIIYERYD